ncbi:MAG: UvrD-helicase domain-containing protein [Bacteroidaceae bacterium]|nr:UvrD-helicase domain-containing protein [Bacteroidaceae bacterium]
MAVQYITLLVARGADEYRRILAVTFTNKATGEMKDRILEQLYGVGHGLPDSEGYLEAIGKELEKTYRLRMDDDEIRKRCREALNKILHDYGRFSVSTIDKFFQSVLTNMARELGLNARLQVELGDKRLLETAVDNLLDGLREGTSKDLIGYLQDYINTRIENDKSWDFREDIKELSSWLFKEQYLRRSTDVRNKSFTLQNIKEFKKALKERQKRLLDVVAEFDASGIDTSQFSNGGDIPNFFDKLRNKKLESMGKRLQGFAEDPMKMVKKADSNNAAICAAAVAMSALLAKAQRVVESLLTIDQILHTITPMALLGVIDEEVKKINRDHNSFTLANTPLVLNRMVEDGDAPFIFEKMGNRFCHVMIDEFQDTSRLQWSNFSVLLLNALAEGNLSMVVGDIKQSIYRWRNGDWHTLKELSDHGLKGAESDPRPLDTNFRSLETIINFNNAFFPNAAETLDKLGKSADGTTITDIYNEVRQKVLPKKMGAGYVRIRISEKPGEDDEQFDCMADMCAQIRLLHDVHHVPYSKMAILLRQRTELQHIISYFGEHMPEVQIISDEAFQLNYSPAVNMMVCALEVICSGDAELTSSLPLRCLMKLYCLHVKKAETPDVDYMLCDPSAVLPKDFLGHLGQLRQMPLYELCEHLYRMLHLDQIPQQESYVFGFFDTLSAYLRDHSSDIQLFLTDWAASLSQQSIPVGEVDGIRIVTIHSSKGLAYHTVFMPYCNWKLEADKGFKDDLLWCEPKDEVYMGLGTLPIHKTSAMKNGAFKADYEEEHFQQRVDELNTLYVAFTRAEANLLAWGEKSSNKGELKNIADLLAACPPAKCEFSKEGLLELGTPASFEQPDKGVESQKTTNRMKPEFQACPIEMHSYEGRMTFRQSRPAAEFVHTSDDELDEKQLGYIEKGKLLHYIFSQIETADEVERVADAMVARGILAGKKQRREVVSLAQRGLQNPLVATWFDGSSQLFNECAILSTDEHGATVNHRPDRVLLTGNRIVVVDYKFGKRDAEHAVQVRCYLQLMHDMHPDKQVEGWLWYVYSNITQRIDL